MFLQLDTLNSDGVISSGTKVYSPWGTEIHCTPERNSFLEKESWEAAVGVLLLGQPGFLASSKGRCSRVWNRVSEFQTQP